MQTFSPGVQSLSVSSLPEPPGYLAEAARFFSASTGCEFPEALAVVLSILAGTVGPIWRIEGPRGASYSAALNTWVCAAPGQDISIPVTNLRAPLDQVFGRCIDKRIAIGEKSLAVHSKRTHELLREITTKLEDLHEPDSKYGSRYMAYVERINELNESKAETARDLAESAFLLRPWILSGSVEDLDDVPDYASDHGLFLDVRDAERNWQLLLRNEKRARILVEGFFGNAISLSAKCHFRPCISNLWTAPAFFQTLLDVPALQTFLVAEMSGNNHALAPEELQEWRYVIDVVFNARMQRERITASLTPEVTRVFVEREHAWQSEIRALPPTLFAAHTHVPVQALKIALHFAQVEAMETEKAIDTVSDHWLSAGFDYAEHLARKAAARFASPMSAGIDITHLVNRLLEKGPTSKRALVRSYHKTSVSEVNVWLKEGMKRGLLEVEGNLVRLTKPDVSVSAPQRSESVTAL